MRKSDQSTMPESTVPHDPTIPVKRRRPLALRLIFWMLILWMVLGWLRFGQTLLHRELVLTYASPGVFAYLVAAGLVWGLIGLPALWGLAARSGWARGVIGVDAVLYPALYWVERLFLWQDENSQGNWPFMLALTLFWLGVVLWGLLGKAGRTYFTEKRT